MKLPLYQIDAFTSQVFSGNPAAVVVMDHWLEDAVLQAIAAENNLSETAFVIPSRERCQLRWFTPTVEVDLCGHATLAAAYILFKEYFPDCGQLDLESQSGMLLVTRRERLLYLDFPSRPGFRLAVDAQLVEALGATPVAALRSRDLLVVFESEAEVRNFRPNYRAIEALDAFALIVTAPGTEVDFVSRFFAPRAGVPEDPVTGSAHCTLIPYWASRLGKSTMAARQLSKRGGELYCELHGDRVLIGGAAIEYLRGEINVPAARVESLKACWKSSGSSGCPR
ncbi:MAG: PhzF family phenazine biosynthesis protein [Candidatus Competibacteraceae bacterium]|nr:PhzF family phenazine biosynthesis protein [Candidatus Competibacteraceae bacterium]